MHSTQFSCSVGRIFPSKRTIPTPEREHSQQEEKETVLGATGKARSSDPPVLRSKLRLIYDECEPVDGKEVCFNQDIADLSVGKVKAK
jgi:hypothetical protein